MNSMKQYAFFFDSSSCSGCKACEMACRDKHDQEKGLRWRRVYEVVGGEWEWDNHKYNTASDDPKYGGAGYKEGRVITVSRVVGGDRTVVWPSEGGNGIYVDALNYYKL